MFTHSVEWCRVRIRTASKLGREQKPEVPTRKGSMAPFPARQSTKPRQHVADAPTFDVHPNLTDRRQSASRRPTREGQTLSECPPTLCKSTVPAGGQAPDVSAAGTKSQICQSMSMTSHHTVQTSIKENASDQWPAETE